MKIIISISRRKAKESLLKLRCLKTFHPFLERFMCMDHIEYMLLGIILFIADLPVFAFGPVERQRFGCQLLIAAELMNKFIRLCISNRFCFSKILACTFLISGLRQNLST